MSVSLREQIARKLNELSGLREKYGEMTIDVLIIQLEALIDKCATPTFSGGEKPFNEKYGLEIGGKFVPFKDLPTDIVQLKKLIENPTKQNIPNVGLRVPDITGQKEYCECKISSHSEDEVDCNSCFVCHKPIFPTNSKPIPAEKKESEKRLTPYQLPEGSWCNHCKQNECWCIERQNNGDWGKPEPKPKDRIKELDRKNYMVLGIGLVIDKINTIIRHINKES
jgi:hypothetical protein